MYIVGTKIKDYYDSAIGQYGIDKRCVYIRETTVIHSQIDSIIDKVKSPSLMDSHGTPNVKHLKSITPFVIGFCGTTYVGFKLTYEIPKYPNEIYPKESVVITYNRNTIEKMFNLFKEKKQYSWSRDSVYKRFMDHYHEVKDDTLFLRFLNPVFIIDFGTNIHGEGYGTKFILNPLLKPYEFYKVFDANQAFQELEMYVGNVLTKPDDPKPIEDKYRMQQRGMDKTSFRQIAPGGKKEKRRQNKLDKKNKNEK